MALTDEIAGWVGDHEFSGARMHRRLASDLRAASERAAREALEDPAHRVVVEGRTGPRGVASVRRHDFESDVLGVTTYRCSAPYGDPAVDRTELSRQIGGALLAEVGRRGGGMAIVRVDADDTAALGGLQLAGFHVYEAATLWVAQSDPEIPELALDGHRIEVLSAAECADLPERAIKAVIDEASCSFRRSHFHADPALDPARADALYELWARNTFRSGWAAHVVTVWRGDRVEGFLGFSVDRSREVPGALRVMTNSFGLALESAAAGIATVMYQTAIRSFDADVLEFGTQLRSPMMRVFARGGRFDGFTASYTLHGWSTG